ncbi:uncharacterized protein TrAtP1_001483 [Trichoderma atroviride]|uniref:Uncharacterized protein n=1 Tax=Hypocrea atroviridis (strain ATCC 20476 / IMI 206040) TaxID=452589 RepID=G9P1A8_HYPAI|nr:uncharacterized protein TRIATDRAFT_85886 [Trichoderma atroviride IMI 206040]EHK43296.1 hypothetical protein TRIATDRAFT_85886 [Trichoderma atroviride IMI 206040]UKZ60198.1 hypothetical protein TrAtP1_001483 [Trichoderma atroviride]
MASIADRIKDRILRKTNTGRITRSRPVQKQQPLAQILQNARNRQNPKKKGTVGDDEDDEDEDRSGDDNHKDGSQPSSKKPIALRRCEFCYRDPIGRQMCKQRYCDYTKGWKGNFIECSNCADHRSQNPGSKHRCKPPLINNVWRKYGVADPVDYRPPTCDQCLNSKMANQCNVDSTLGYGCTISKACRDGKCTVNGQEMEARPNTRVDAARWIRAECHACQNKTKKGTVTAGCSWLRDRSTRDQACSYCQTNNLTCLSGGRVVANPQRLTLPRTWAVKLQVFDKGFVECRRINPERRYCKRCWEDDHDHCRADAGSYSYSCNRCTQLGVDCIDAGDDTSYPLFDLARVGIGGFMPFVECNCCREAGRNCDLQRPCDSCIKHGDECDDWVGDTAKYCIKGRLDPPPGPLYYLALGYGSGGVDDPKDGSAIEHWVGPATSIYGIPENQNRNFIATMGVQLRSMLSPPGAPPHGDATQGGLVSGRASGITREQIAAWIKERWPQAVPMNQLGHYRERVEAVRQKMQDIRDGKIVSALFSDFPGHGGGDKDDDDDTNNPGVQTRPNDDADPNRGVDAHGNSGHVTTSSPAALIFDTSAPDWLSEYINSDMIDDGVASPPFECPTLPGQSQFGFDAAAPSSQVPANLQFSPFEVSHLDPDLVLIDIDQDLDTLMQIDSLPLEASSALEDAEYIDHNPLSIDQEEAMFIQRPQPTLPTPYSFVLGCPKPQDSPFCNVLGLVPEVVTPIAPGGDETCSEIRDNVHCNNPVALDSTCQCLLHEDNAAHVCNACCKSSAKQLNDNLVTNRELHAFRAYLCADCTAQVSNSIGQVLRRRIVGAVNIWGDCSDSYYTQTELELETPLGRVNFKGAALPVTGCACATKLLAQRLCWKHRSRFGGLIVAQAVKMREWCLQRFGRNVCPGCLVDKPPHEANSPKNTIQTMFEQGPKAWVCLACGDWVVNQKQMGLVPGWEQWHMGT